MKKPKFTTKTAFALSALLAVCIFSADLKAQSVTMDDLLDYKKECYNDSTLIKTHFLPKGETYCIVDYECINSSHYRMVWKHRAPTFEDFIVWLQKKYYR